MKFTKKAVGAGLQLLVFLVSRNVRLTRPWQGTGKANFPVQYDLSGRVEVIVKGSKTQVIGDCAFFLLRTSWTKFLVCPELTCACATLFVRGRAPRPCGGVPCRQKQVSEPVTLSHANRLLMERS